MYAIIYILVNDLAAKGSACKSRHRFIPNIGHCIEGFTAPGFRVQGCLSDSSFAPRDSSSELGLSSRLGVGSRERAKLLNELCRLRCHWPEVPIPGVFELGTISSHTTTHVSLAMIALRREMSDLP